MAFSLKFKGRLFSSSLVTHWRLPQSLFAFSAQLSTPSPSTSFSLPLPLSMESGPPPEQSDRVLFSVSIQLVPPTVADLFVANWRSQLNWRFNPLGNPTTRPLFLSPHTGGQGHSLHSPSDSTTAGEEWLVSKGRVEGGRGEPPEDMERNLKYFLLLPLECTEGQPSYLSSSPPPLLSWDLFNLWMFFRQHLNGP